MKKLMILALMFMSTSFAFAGDSPQLKAIMSAKTYAEAASLLKSNLAQLVSNEEKAKAYNKLVDLALEDFNKQQSIIDNNYMQKSMNPKFVEAPFDTVAYYESSYNVITNAVECDKYDQQPNAKGKIKPKFFNANSQRVGNCRLQLINGGQAFSSNADRALAYFGLYSDTGSMPLFQKSITDMGGDQYLGEISRVAAVYSFQKGDLKNASRYCDTALKDTAVYKDAIGLKTYLMTQGLNNHEDSVACVKELEELYVREKGHEQVFAILGSMYSSMGQKDALNKLIDDKLAADPNCYSAWAMRGQELMYDEKYDEALEYLNKALKIQPDNAMTYTYIGFCYDCKARASEDNEEIKKFFSQAVPYLEKARELDPTQDQAKWSLSLFNCYYILYGENDPRTKEVEALTH